jgi:uncharacterized protein YggE
VVGKGTSGAQISLSFTIKDADAVRKLVLEDAVRKAKSNAETLATAAGVRLGSLVQMDYGWVEVRVTTDEYLCAPCDDPLIPSPDIEPGDVRAEDTVTLMYEIA